jgi:hypothetical protein
MWRYAMRVINSRFLGRFYYKFQVGFAPMSYLLSFIGFLTFVKVWQSTFDYYGVPFVIALVIFPISILCIAAGLGHVMVKKNIQGEMTSLVNTEANPEFVTLLQTIDRLEYKIDELRGKE